MVKLEEGLILSRGAPKTPTTFSYEKGTINRIPFEEKYKFAFLKLKDQALNKGSFIIDDQTIYPSEENSKSVFFLQINSLANLGLCFLTTQEEKKQKVKTIQEELIKFRDFPTDTQEEKDNKFSAIIDKIATFEPSYVLFNENDKADVSEEILLKSLETLSQKTVLIILDKKNLQVEENDEEPIENKEEIQEISVVSINIGDAQQMDEDDNSADEPFLTFDKNKNLGKAIPTTFKNNAMVFFSFLIPTIGVIAFLMLLPVYLKTENKFLAVPFIITIIVCFVLYILMTYKCTSYLKSKNKAEKKRKIIIFNVLNSLVTIIGIGLGIVIYILFKIFDTDLKNIGTQTLSIVLAIIFGIILITVNIYIYPLLSKFLSLFKKKK